MGFGVWAPLPMRPFTDLYRLPQWTGDEMDQALAQDWYLSGLSAPDPVDIPYAWLSGPFRSRLDKAVTRAEITKAGGGTSIVSVPADEQVTFTATLECANDVDAPNLASFATRYYDEPRTRIAQVRVVLDQRSREEIWTILGVAIGTRIRITDHPDTWPPGAAHQVVEGIGNELLGSQRIVVWATSPVIGETPGEVGPFFRVGASELGGPDQLPW